MKTEEAEELDYVVIDEIEPYSRNMLFKEFISDNGYERINHNGELVVTRACWEDFKNHYAIDF